MHAGRVPFTGMPAAFIPSRYLVSFTKEIHVTGYLYHEFYNLRK